MYHAIMKPKHKNKAQNKPTNDFFLTNLGFISVRKITACCISGCNLRSIPATIHRLLPATTVKQTFSSPPHCKILVLSTLMKSLSTGYSQIFRPKGLIYRKTNVCFGIVC